MEKTLSVPTDISFTRREKIRGERVVQTEPLQQGRRSRFRFLTIVRALFRRPYPRLDLETMPAHMQRDLGFLDGRDPRYEAKEMR